MTLKDKIQGRLVVDEDSILESNIDRVEPLFDLFNDGTISIADDFRGTKPENRILIYLIAQRYAKEGELDESDVLQTEYFYEKIDRGERSVRDYLQNLREAGLVSKEGKSTHRLVAENLPDALDRLEESQG